MLLLLLLNIWCSWSGAVLVLRVLPVLVVVPLQLLLLLLLSPRPLPPVAADAHTAMAPLALPPGAMTSQC